MKVAVIFLSLLLTSLVFGGIALGFNYQQGCIQDLQIRVSQLSLANELQAVEIKKSKQKEIRDREQINELTRFDNRLMEALSEQSDPKPSSYRPKTDESDWVINFGPKGQIPPPLYGVN